MDLSAEECTLHYGGESIATCREKSLHEMRSRKKGAAKHFLAPERAGIGSSFFLQIVQKVYSQW
jgi:hypothetical protein